MVSCKKNEIIAPTPVVPVTPTPTLSDTKAITSFSFTKTANPNLVGDITASIDLTNRIITATFPAGTVVTALKAAFTISANASLKVGTTTQVSAITANDFTNPITFIVTAENGTTQTYITSITLTPATTTSNIVTKKEEFAPGPPIQTAPINTTDYTYNASNVLTSYKDNFGSYKFDYDANGLLTTQTVYDNTNAATNVFTYTLNGNKMPTSISGTYGQTVESFTYNTSGQVTKYTKSYYGVIKDTYDYTLDSKNRIVSAKYVSANDAVGLYSITTYTYFDDVYDPEPSVKVFIRPGITGGLDPTTNKMYAIKTSNYQKYNAIGPINANTAYTNTYSVNTNGFITNNDPAGNNITLKYTYK